MARRQAALLLGVFAFRKAPVRTFGAPRAGRSSSIGPAVRADAWRQRRV